MTIQFIPIHKNDILTIQFHPLIEWKLNDERKYYPLEAPPCEKNIEIEIMSLLNNEMTMDDIQMLYRSVDESSIPLNNSSIDICVAKNVECFCVKQRVNSNDLCIDSLQLPLQTQLDLNQIKLFVLNNQISSLSNNSLNLTTEEMNEKKLYYSQLKTNEFVEIKTLSELNEMILLNKINSSTLLLCCNENEKWKYSQVMKLLQYHRNIPMNEHFISITLSFDSSCNSFNSHCNKDEKENIISLISSDDHSQSVKLNKVVPNDLQQSNEREMIMNEELPHENIIEMMQKDDLNKLNKSNANVNQSEELYHPFIKRKTKQSTKLPKEIKEMKQERYCKKRRCLRSFENESIATTSTIKPVDPTPTTLFETPIITEDEFEVERLVKKKVVNGKTSYLVKWKKYPAKDNTWEDEKDLKKKYAHLISSFDEKKKNESKPKKVVHNEEVKHEEGIVFDVWKEQKEFRVLYQSGNNPRNVISLNDLKKRNPNAVIDFLLKKQFGSFEDDSFNQWNSLNSLNDKKNLNKQFGRNEMMNFAKEE